MWLVGLLLFILFFVVTAIRYQADIRRAYERLESYEVEVVETEFGKLSYIDEGSGDAVLLSHGIFGGYDQSYVSLTNLVGNGYRKLAPSRFGSERTR